MRKQVFAGRNTQQLKSVLVKNEKYGTLSLYNEIQTKEGGQKICLHYGDHIKKGIL